MSAQREGFLDDILEKVKDIITPDDDNKPDGPVVEPKCCGPTPKFAPTAEDLTAEESKVHDADCPNHPDNLPKDVVA
ncbi:hypothetical protein ACIA8G_14395 [Lentzea sp. NPDC051213]|uniref:hypothetical protein n=1 Tax=Lentzea sp. NPDC051213 TaxID=3364126 RepID=UPI0037A28D97